MLDPSRAPEPRSAVSREPARKVQPAHAIARPRRETILLVEDELAVRKFLSRSLAKDGYRVLEAGDGEEGLAKSDNFKGEIHPLITEVMMPVINFLLTFQVNG